MNRTSSQEASKSTQPSKPPPHNIIIIRYKYTAPLTLKAESISVFTETIFIIVIILRQL